MSGWVLDINAVSSIDLYVDGAKVATADINLPRVDVLNVFPTYANSPTALPGFITSFYTEKGAPNFVYPSGAHTVSIKVVESANPNVSIDIADIPVTVDNTLNQTPFGYIDIPDANPQSTEGFDSAHPVAGWAIDDSVCPVGSSRAKCGVDHIDILVDGQIVAGAVCCNVPGQPSSGSTAGPGIYGTTRPDVQAAFPDVPDSLFRLVRQHRHDPVHQRPSYDHRPGHRRAGGFPRDRQPDGTDRQREPEPPSVRRSGLSPR